MKRQKLALHSLKNKDQCPITWDSKQYIETQLTQLNYAAKNEKKDVFEVKNPAEAMLPRTNLSTAFVFAKQDKFFAYPNNYNHYVNFYRNTFQHGGISPEEMIIPVISLTNR